MSEDGAAGKRSSSRLTSAYAAPAAPPAASRDTTLGGVQKTKFAPVVAPRRVKKEDEGGAEKDASTTSSANPQQHQHNQRPPRGIADRGRGRGRGGRGGLLGARGGPSQAPVAISGPFSLGPQTAAKGTRNSAAAAMFRAPSSSAAGPGRARGSRTATPSSAEQSHCDDDNLMDLEKMMQLETLSLGHDHTPVYLGTEPEDKDKAKAQRIEDSQSFSVSDLLEALHGSVGLFQLPPRLPKIKSESAPAVDQEGQPPQEQQIPDNAEGLYGKLLVHASGKVSIEIDGVRFALEAGQDPTDLPHVTACQSLLAIDPEYEQSFELAQINHTFVASPSLSQFLPL